ncbi:hypothetical protein J437_LFUL003806 [Ladona fulva]|uniref:Uncharacterized protein n=1 Tax=Ladona fulva TaxID=123851 RepID=A0A8K0NWM6_LADFU|nr:hypothetical protein J437_LFUL003806 [Ladona fulva]
MFASGSIPYPVFLPRAVEKGEGDISDGPEGPSPAEDDTPEALLLMDPRHSCSEALIAETSFTGRYSTPPHPRSLLHTRPFHFPPPPPYPPPPPREDNLQDTQSIFCCDAPFKPGPFLVAEEEDEGCGGSGTMTAVSTGDEVEDHHSLDYSYAYNTGPFYPQQPPPQRLQHHHHHHHLHHHRLYPPPPPPSPDARKAGEPRGSTKHHPKDRHTFISTYGVEENIYEEICEARGAFENPYEFAEDSGGGASVGSGVGGLLGTGFLMGRRRKVAPVKNGKDLRATEGLPGCSKDAACGSSGGASGGEARSSNIKKIVEEEVRRVQMGHNRVLGELNLSVEAMLMPDSQSEGEDDEEEEGYGDGFRPSSATTTTTAEEEAELLLSVGPTDELLSPDSGFQSSSSGSVTSSMRAAPDTPRSTRSIPASMPPPTRSRGMPPPPPPVMGGVSSHIPLTPRILQEKSIHKSESLDLRKFLSGGSPSPSRKLLVPPPVPLARRKGLVKVEGNNHPLGIFSKGWRLPGFGNAAKGRILFTIFLSLLVLLSQAPRRRLKFPAIFIKRREQQDLRSNHRKFRYHSPRISPRFSDSAGVAKILM